MTESEYIVKLIKALSDTDPYIKTIYTEGGCYRFHLFLKELYPTARPVKNTEFNHIGTVIYGVCYDINGIVAWEHHEITDEEIKIVKDWCFTDHNMLLIGECPVCEEPLIK